MEFLRIDHPEGQVIVRIREERDIPAHLDYLYNSPPDYLRSIGFAPEKFLSRADMELHIRKRITSPKPLAIAAEIAGKTVAMVFIDEPKLEDPIPRLHFHIFDSSLRGRGLGGPIFKAAVNGFYQIYGYRTLHIEPRVDNAPMNALMKKLGFKHLKNRTLKAGSMTPDILVSQYEILAPL